MCIRDRFGSATEAPTGPDVETGVDETAGSLLCTGGSSALAKQLTKQLSELKICTYIVMIQCYTLQSQ